jgi:cobalt-zinc-cadmium efflux system membrane fusion protein
MIRWNIRSIVAIALFIGGFVAFTGGQVWAHAGHGDEPEQVVTNVAPRTQAESDDLELVAVLAAKGTLLIYLDRFQTNEPVTGAIIEVSANNGPGLIAKPQSDGIYLVAAPWVDQAGSYALSFTVTAGDLTDLLASSLTIAAPEAVPVAVAGVGSWRLPEALTRQKGLITPVLGFVLGVLVMLAIRATGRARAAVGGVAIVAVLLLGGVAFGQTPDVIEASRRLPDGSVFMPKPAQRLLAVRTILGAAATASKSVQVIGLIVPDPNAAGRVQASQSGRIDPGAGGLAYIGQHVSKGDVLAEVAPAIGSVERATVGAQIADVDQQVRLGEQRVSRLSGLAGSVAGKEIDEARAELDGARKRRAAMAPTLAGREMLRAPVSGVVSVANALAGQLVDSKDVVFEIVDPSRLWVEALAFDPLLAEQMKRASAVTSDGKPLALSLVGRGLSLRQGAIPLVFRIEAPPAGLNVGAPVTVLAEVNGDRKGIAVPRSALARLPNGGAMVWDHVSAERFVPRPVRVEPLDGANMLVMAGISPGQRIVISGADLLSQVR